MNFDEYVDYLMNPETYQDEREYLFDAVTITESSFFRDPNQLKVIEEIVLPELLEKAANEQQFPLRILSAGCAAGEEPYTLAMIIYNRFPSLASQGAVEITGIDINQHSLEKAVLAEYREHSIKHLPQEFLQSYMVTKGLRYSVRDKIKKIVNFRMANLVDTQQMQELGKFDIILCRNVLIYLEKNAKVKVVQTLYDLLNIGGYLFIGQSESLHGITRAFKLHLFNKAIAYKKE